MTDTDFDIRTIIRDILSENPDLDQIELLREVEKRLEEAENRTELERYLKS